MRPSAVLPDRTYVELVEALFGTLTPTLIMTGLFAGVGILAYVQTGDRLLLAMATLGMAISVVRIAILLQARSRAGFDDAAQAAAFDRRYSIAYLCFAAVVGLFSARLFGLNIYGLHGLAAVLVTGYCAGVAAGVFVRPKLCVASILLAVVPLIATAARLPMLADRLLALVLAAFTAGGIESSLTRYRSEATKIAQRHRLATISRQDTLTTLPNRLALQEELEARLDAREASAPWFHLIAIDGLVAVNREHGHAAGDAVLAEVAARLGRAVGATGTPARLGGGEFGVLQAATGNQGEAQWLSERIGAALADVFDLDGGAIWLGATLSYVKAGPFDGVAQLMVRASEAVRSENLAEAAAPAR